MLSAADRVRIYLQLADHYEQRAEAQSRDRCLVLAADAALSASKPDEAESIRQRLLQLNPHHLLKPFPSMQEALRSRDVVDYVNALRKRHPAENASTLLGSPQAGAEGPPAAGRGSSPPAETRPPEVFGLRPTDDSGLQIRPQPGPVPGPGNASRFRAAPAEPARPARENLPPLPAAPPREDKASPFRPVRGSGKGSAPVYSIMREGYPGASPGAWMCSLLFLLVLIGGLGLTVYSLGRTFIPEAWLPEKLLKSAN